MKSYQNSKEPSGWLQKSRPPVIGPAGILILLALWLVPICGLGAQEGPAPRDFPPFLYAAEGARQIQQFDRQGRVSWAYPAEMARDVWALTNGHVLFCFNNDYSPARHDNVSGVVEVTADKRIAFQFMTTGQVWSCQRLADGNTLVAAASQGQLLIVSPDSRIVQTIRVLNQPGHSCLRNARQIPNGHFLVAEESAHAAREYSREGTLVREIRVSFAPFSAVRLTNGNTVICGQQKIVEVDYAGNILWSIDGPELPELGIRWFAGLQALPNGNLFVCNAGGRIPFLEISREKQILWHSPAERTYPVGHGIQRLDVAGPPCK